MFISQPSDESGNDEHTSPRHVHIFELIIRMKYSSSFDFNYNPQYLGLIGDKTQKSVGLDPGFGSSNFGIYITELVVGEKNTPGQTLTR